MFTKIGELVYRDDGKTKDVGKKYSYTEDLELANIIELVENSNYSINYVDVDVDDEYTYGQGRQTIEDFKEIYRKLYSLHSVSFVIDEINSRLVIYPKKREASLQFFRVTEVPQTEIFDIIGEKKMSL